MPKKAVVRERDVAWNDELREDVWSWRGHVNPAFEREYVERAGDLAAAFAERRTYMGYDTHMRPWFEAGRARVPASEREMMFGALAIRDEKRMPAALDAHVEAALVALEIQPVFSAVPFWIAKGGLELAMRTLALCHEYHSSGKDHLYGNHGVWVVHAPERAGEFPEYAETGWNIVRAMLATADDATYAKMRRVAEDLRAHAHAAVKALIAVAFATERAWADEAATEALATPHPSPWCKRLVTVASLDLASRLAARTEWVISDDEIATLLAREGGAAAPVIAAALGAACNNAHRKRLAKLLALVANERAAASFVPWIKNSAVSPIAWKYYASIPEITRRALEPLSRGDSIEARGAKIILGSLPE